ncbi:hypothetical protein LIER_36879 [Lithospermum erythrorhizon]|uniref:U-box domain-containing protein n=1 Tax=Lithospermum erythrorhizon TaxID=34254 RepID=A0AAV3PDX1_LITER
MISSWRKSRAARNASDKKKKPNNELNEARQIRDERILVPDRTLLTSNKVSDMLAKIEVARGRGDGEYCRKLVVDMIALAKENDKNKKCIAKNGAGEVLSCSFDFFASKKFSGEGDFDSVLEEILSALTMISLPLEGEVAKTFLGSASSVRCIVWLLRREDLSVRRNAILWLKEVISFDQNNNLLPELLLENEGALEATVKLIKVPISPAVTNASLLVMYHMVSQMSTPSSSNTNKTLANKIMAMGVVEMLVDMLVDSQKTSISEKALGVLDGICSFEQGRDKAYENALAIPVLVKKLLRVSELATEFSVSILWKLIIKNGKVGVDNVEEALQVGAFQKLLVLLQVGCSERTKEEATDLLKLLNMHRFKVECIDSSDFKNLKRTF